jgi:hypothetical protein
MVKFRVRRIRTFDEGLFKVGFEECGGRFAAGEFGFVGCFCLEGLCGSGEVP